MERRLAESLDRFITGNYGEDQFKRLEVPEKKPIMPWEAAAERSTIPRIVWKDVIGMTLTKYVAQELAKGSKSLHMQEYLFHEAVGNQALAEKGWTHEEIAKNIKIGVSARISEMRSEKTAYKTQKAELLTWTARIIRTSSGSRIVGVAKEVTIPDGARVEVQIRRVDP